MAKFSISDYNDSDDPAVNTAAILCKNHNPEVFRGEYWLNNRCDYVNYRENGEVVRSQLDDVCHARAAGPYIHGWFNYRHDETDEMLPDYINYLVNESPFADIFLSKNVDAIMKWGFVINFEKHKGLGYGALIASRATWEHADHAILWWHLIKAGIHPDYAYMVGFSRKLDFKRNTVFPSYVSHGGIDPRSWSVNCASKWMNHEPRGTSKERVANRTFSEGKGKSKDLELVLDEPAELFEKGGNGRFAAVEPVLKLETFVEYHKKTWLRICQENGWIKGEAPFRPAKKKFNHEPEEDV